MGIRFRDFIYGEIELPAWVAPFVSIPEFARLRGVGLSNVDPFYLKDFGGASRWSHSIGVAHLANIAAQKLKLSPSDSRHLILAALLHDVGTPPFAHTLEAVLSEFDHENNGKRLLSAMASDLNDPSFPIFSGAPPQFGILCARLSKGSGLKIDPRRVAEIITGTDEVLGSLLNNSVDLDNADNVIRASYLCGIKVDLTLPLRLIDDIVTCWRGDEENLVRGSAVEEWTIAREELYTLFGSESLEDISREALLQKIIRSAISCGLAGERLIWNTDEGLLFDIEALASAFVQTGGTFDVTRGTGLLDLLRRYRLLEQLPLLHRITFESSQSKEWSSIHSAEAVDWLERFLFSKLGEVAVIAKRGSKSKNHGLIKSLGSIFVMRISQKSQPDGGRSSDQAPQNVSSDRNSIRKDVLAAALAKPWKGRTITGGRDIIQRLDAVGDWSFKLSRNKPLHAYSSTFVHNVPACLLRALGVADGTVLDPFGGTAQTISEVCKSGGEGISSDSNSIATLVASAKLRYFSPSLRRSFRSISESSLISSESSYPDEFPRQFEWFHETTYEQLARIKGFIEGFGKGADFLRVAFSSILTQCTERRGRNANYFADNTPLPKGMAGPSYIDPYGLFLRRLQKNVDLMESYYEELENRNLDPEVSLKSVQAVRQSALGIGSRGDGEWIEKFDAIITSPPYLCMTDYVLGSRLSYYWLFPNRFEVEAAEEIGRRRGRFSTARAASEYELKMGVFAEQAHLVLKKKGFLALVIGGSTAERFSGVDPLKAVDEAISALGFSRIWQKLRNISWHKNGGKQALNSELIVVYQKR